MQHATLYKRTKTGAIQYWQVEVIEASMDSSGWNIIKHSGQLGTTSPVVHKETITQGKNIGRSNESTPMEQAESQALADWTKKHDEGYKTLADLGCLPDGYVPLANGEIEKNWIPAMLEKALPQFNTDANGNVKPMLAKAVDWDKVTYPCLVQPKLDGVRCLMVMEEQRVTFLSRNGKPLTTLSHIAADVEDYIGSINDCEDYRFILDGEIYSDEITFQEIISAVKKQRPDSLKLKFRAYDIINDKTQDERIRDVVNIVNKICSHHVHMVESKFSSAKEDILYLHDLWVSQGNEGAMIRLLNGVYGQGQRSSSLMKVKEFNDGEFAFKNFEFGQRGVRDLIAVCWDTTGAAEFRAKMEGSDALKEKLYARNDLEGKSLTVRHFGFTDSGLPRFPIGVGFRDYE
jgi:DNA ligase-1